MKNNRHSGKQGKLLKKFKQSNEFFSCVQFSQSNIYFKICLYKFLCKFSRLKKSTLTLSYFKSNFQLIKKGKCVRQMQTYLVRNICFIIFGHCLDNFVQSGEFYPWIILSSLDNFIHEEFYLVWRISSNQETFIQCRKYSTVQ